MPQELKGKVYDIQPFSVHDGPGIRTTVFLKGCPLRCPWCHSPESQAFHSQLSWIAMKCVACGLCAPLCPLNAITYGETEVSALGKVSRPLIIDRGICTDCGKCTEKCHAKALTICGTDYTVQEVIEIIEGDLPFYKRSGGGVTVSGGEPLSQLQFTTELLKTLKEMDIHTALDTTGFASANAILSVLPYTDVFLYDLKHMDPETHEKVMGVPNGPIHANARLIAERGGKLQIRVPLITGINDSAENITATAEFCAGIRDAITVVQLLPFHNLGDAKYPRIGRDDKFNVPAVTDEKLEECKQIFRSVGIDVIVH